MLRRHSDKFVAGQRIIAMVAVLVAVVVFGFVVYTMGQHSVPTVAPLSAAQNVQIASLQHQVTVLQDQVNSTSGLLDFLLAALTALLALGGLTSFVSWYRNESRQRETLSLAIAGERAAQQRAEEVHQTFLGASKDTLDLVNGTLGLAKDASDRAANAIQRKAEVSLAQLDRMSCLLIAQVPPQEDRAIVAEQARRSELISLANKIAGFEVNRFILPTDLPLTPACAFIRGMQFHLEQQFHDALECWQSVALDPATSTELQSKAWYWIGYELNNLGDFSSAEQAFRRALENAIGARAFELRRIGLESRFFDQGKEQANVLIKPLTDLLAEIDEMRQDEAIAAARVKVLATLGNVNHQAGREAATEGLEDDARGYFAAAARYFDDAGRYHDRWAGFGLAEALYQLGEVKQAEKLFTGQVRERALDEYLNRVEPRTKVLARTTELYCYLRVGRLRDQVETARNNVIEALGQVDERMTVYSQIQRRNVSKAEFRKDLECLVNTGS